MDEKWIKQAENGKRCGRPGDEKRRKAKKSEQKRRKAKKSEKKRTKAKESPKEKEKEKEKEQENEQEKEKVKVEEKARGKAPRKVLRCRGAPAPEDTETAAPAAHEMAALAGERGGFFPAGRGAAAPLFRVNA